jgi:hypothetical protein
MITTGIFAIPHHYTSGIFAIPSYTAGIFAIPSYSAHVLVLPSPSLSFEAIIQGEGEKKSVKMPKCHAKQEVSRDLEFCDTLNPDDNVASHSLLEKSRDYQG